MRVGAHVVVRFICRLVQIGKGSLVAMHLLDRNGIEMFVSNLPSPTTLHDHIGWVAEALDIIDHLIDVSVDEGSHLWVELIQQ